MHRRRRCHSVVLCKKNLTCCSTTLLSSIPYNTMSIQLPQRFQIVEGDSPLRAGVRLLPFNLLVGAGAAIGNMITGKLRVPPIYACLMGCALLSVGTGLMTTLPQASPSSGLVYLYEILAGLGMGFTFGITIAIPAFVLERRDLGKASTWWLGFMMLTSPQTLVVVVLCKPESLVVLSVSLSRQLS